MPEWRVKYDGACSRCGAPLLRGKAAVWERATRSIRCVECPGATQPSVQEAPPEPAPPAPLVDPGVAGASARREYERRHEAREQRITERFGTGWRARIVRAVAVEPQSTRAWAIGAAGEEKLAAELAKVPAIRVLNDRRVPRTRGNIDHLVVAPAGVFVVDAKNLSGRIEIRDRGGWFRTDNRLYVGGRDRSGLARGMIWQIEAVQAALLAAGVEPPPPVSPVLCFIDGDWPALFPPDEFEGVRLEGPRSAVRLMTRTDVLTSDGIDALTGVLASAFPPKVPGAAAGGT